MLSRIIGYKKGTGKYKRYLGAFECALEKDPKIKFTISGMDDEIRMNYKTTHPIGTLVTFTYMGLSLLKCAKTSQLFCECELRVDLECLNFFAIYFYINYLYE